MSKNEDAETIDEDAVLRAEQQRITELRQAMWDAGFRAVPVSNAFDEGSSPGKRPVDQEWQTKAREYPPRAAVEPATDNALNTGILCDGLRPVDVDIDDPEIAQKARQIIEGLLGKGPVKTRSNSPKHTILYRAAEGAPKKRSVTGSLHDSKADGMSRKVEVLGHGQQMVIDGWHETAVEIEWEGGSGPGTGVSLDGLVPVTEDQIDAVLAELGELIGAAQQDNNSTSNKARDGRTTKIPVLPISAEIEDVAAALSVIPNDGPPNWDHWKKIGMAIWSASGGSANGFETFDAWSGKNAAYDSDATRTAWAEITASPPDSIGAGTLFHLAAKHRPGWRPPSRKRTGEPANTNQVHVDGFEMTSNGLFFTPPPKGEDENSVPKFVSDPFEIVGQCRDPNSSGWGLFLRWQDPSKVQHEVIIPRKMLPQPATQIAAMLEDGGLRCSNNPILLRSYLSQAAPPCTLRIVREAGWHRDDCEEAAYAFPSGEVFGRANHNVVLANDVVRSDEGVGTAGTLTEWQEQVARYAGGNSRLAFFVCAALAGPLLDINSEPSGGFHIVGKSRSGKTTAALVAASVWGEPSRKVSQWRATDNGLEAQAKGCSDGTLILDEIGQASAKVAGDSIYMLANNSGKQRADVLGNARTRAAWRVLILSTGEIGLRAKMQEAGQSAATGLDVRLVNIDADSGCGLGAFETIHNFPTAAEFADHLRTVSGRFYGTAIRAFLEQLSAMRLEREHELRDLLTTKRAEFRKQHVMSGADGQIESVAGRFSLIAAAGELAIEMQVLPWKPGEAERAAASCFRSWLSMRGHSGAGEDEMALAHIRGFIIQHRDTRFSRINDDFASVRDRVGWTKQGSNGDDYLFQKDQWDNVVFKGTSLDPKRVLATLNNRDLLKTTGGRMTAKQKVGKNNLWVVHVLSDIFGGN